MLGGGLGSRGCWGLSAAPPGEGVSSSFAANKNHHKVLSQARFSAPDVH